MPSNLGTLTAGILRHKITVKQNQSVKNARGVPEDNFATMFTTMAAYVPQSGTTYFQDSAINTSFQAIFRTRWRPSAADSSMIIDSPFGRFSIIQAADVDGLHKEIQYYCTSSIGNG